VANLTWLLDLRIIVGVRRTPLSESNPEVAAQAVGWDPSLVATNSNRKLRWRCSLGHEWEATVFGRTRPPGNGCPYCGNRKVLEGFNDIATTHPHIAAQASGWDPTTVITGSGQMKEWRCEHGHEWNATPSHRIKGAGCLVCLNRQVLEGFNDLATTHPALAAQAHKWDPSTVVSGSKARRLWQCDRGHEWEAQVSERVRRNTGCPQCANRPVAMRHSSLVVEHPEVAAQAAGWDPSTVTSGSSAIRLWRCSEGHEWKARVSHRTRGTGCPVCTKRRIIKGVNDLATTHPALAAQAVGWDPTTIGSGTPQRLRWRCAQGHEWISRADVRANGSGCPFCSHYKLWPGFNDLATTNPDLAAQAFGWDPTTCMAGSNVKRHWRCELGHEWDAIVASRASGNNCAICSGRNLLAGFNDLATRYPELAKEADGWDPQTVVSGSKKKLAWRCAEGHSWDATVASRTRTKGAGCPTCTSYGFSSDLPGYLYLIGHSSWGLLKVGISNVPEQRIELHKTRGWHLIDQIGPKPGQETFELEQRILRGLRSRGAERPPHELENFDGYTESWVMTSFPASSVRQLVDLAEVIE
jgi:translation initiation factor IF-1